MDLLVTDSLIDPRVIKFNHTGDATFAWELFLRLDGLGLIDHTTEIANRPPASELFHIIRRHRGLAVQTRVSRDGFAPFALFGIILPEYYENDILPFVSSARESDLCILYNGNCQFWMQW